VDRAHPRTRSLARLEENLGVAGLRLTAEDVREFDEALVESTVVQPRRCEAHMGFIDH
jgi:diketogulonate reductase-like aldo/keto reductase